MDETDAPQTPPELLIILAAIADEKIRMQTIAPSLPDGSIRELTTSVILGNSKKNSTMTSP